MNVGVRFIDGSEVVYYRSMEIVPMTGDVHVVLGPANVAGELEHIAIITTSDIKDIFEVDAQEVTA